MPDADIETVQYCNQQCIPTIRTSSDTDSQYQENRVLYHLVTRTYQ